MTLSVARNAENSFEHELTSRVGRAASPHRFWRVKLTARETRSYFAILITFTFHLQRDCNDIRDEPRQMATRFD